MTLAGCLEVWKTQPSSEAGFLPWWCFSSSFLQLTSHPACSSANETQLDVSDREQFLCFSILFSFSHSATSWSLSCLSVGCCFRFVFWCFWLSLLLLFLRLPSCPVCALWWSLYWLDCFLIWPALCNAGFSSTTHDFTDIFWVIFGIPELINCWFGDTSCFCNLPHGWVLVFQLN